MIRGKFVAPLCAIIPALVLTCLVVCNAGERQDITSEEIIKQTNQERADRKIPLLRVSKTLNKVAQIRLEDMLAKGYFAHRSPSGEDVTDVAGSLNYDYSRIGENLARGNFKNAKDLVTFWLKSPQHRKNMLSPNYKEIGVAVGREQTGGGLESWRAVQVFGSTIRPEIAY